MLASVVSDIKLAANAASAAVVHAIDAVEVKKMSLKMNNDPFNKYVNFTNNH